MGRPTRDHPFWDGLTWLDELSGDTTPITSVDSMVRVAQNDTIDNGTTIDFLAIFGHGAAGFQGVGCGKHMENSGTLSLYYQAIAKTTTLHLMGQGGRKVSALNGVLSDDAEILLGGC